MYRWPCWPSIGHAANIKLYHSNLLGVRPRPAHSALRRRYYYLLFRQTRAHLHTVNRLPALPFRASFHSNGMSRCLSFIVLCSRQRRVTSAREHKERHALPIIVQLQAGPSPSRAAGQPVDNTTPMGSLPTDWSRMSSALDRVENHLQLVARPRSGMDSQRKIRGKWVHLQTP